MDERVLGLIGELYDAASAPELWPASLGRLRDLFRANMTYILLQGASSPGVQLFASAGLDTSKMSVFNELYVGLSPCLQAVRRREIAAVDVTPLRKTAFFNDFLRPQDIYCGVVGRVSSTADEFCSIATTRGRTGEPFEERDVRLLATLLPHLRRSVFLHRQLARAEAARSSAEEALDWVAYGVVLLDARGRVFHANQRARTLLAESDGLTLSRDGFLLAASRAESATLSKAIQGAVLGHTRVRVGGAVTLTRPSAKRSLSVLVAPLGAERRPGAALAGSAAVFVSDPEHDPPGLEAQLCALHGLSAAEGRVAMALLQGLEPRAISETLHVSLATVRTHLRNLFQRTGTRGQADLVRVLLKSAGVRGTRSCD